MLDVYIEVIKKSNANTGYIDEQSLLEAEKAVADLRIQLQLLLK